MTYLELIGIVGEETFKRYGKGWYCLDYIFDHTESHIDRYALMGMLPFCEINVEYDVEYRKDMDIGSTYDWLGETLTDEEEIKKRIIRMKEYLKLS